MKRTHIFTRNILIFWTLFIGISALWGSLMMFIDPSGKLLHMDGILIYFLKLPLADILYNNYVFPGIALLLINGVPNLTAAILMLKHKKSGITLGTTAGLILMLWITIQFIIFPFDYLLLSFIFFFFGLCQLITGIVCLIRYKQDHFSINIMRYKKISDDSKVLVVYFSRTGYTEKIAHLYANENKAEIYRIKPLENINKTRGFWWSGRFAMHKWPMKIQKCPLDLTKYDKIVLCSPLWVFHIAAPIRQFALDYKDNIQQTDYIFTHFTRGKYVKAAAELDHILNIKRGKVYSLTIRYGRVIKRISY